MLRPADLSVRKGRSNAICKTCGTPIGTTGERVVYSSASNSSPEHHHVQCFLMWNSRDIAKLYELLQTSGIAREVKDGRRTGC